MGTVKSSFPFAQLFEDIYRLRTGFNLSKKISCQIDTMKRIGISRYTLLLYYGSYSVWTSHFKNPSARLPKASVRISLSLKFNAFLTKISKRQENARPALRGCGAVSATLLRSSELLQGGLFFEG